MHLQLTKSNHSNYSVVFQSSDFSYYLILWFLVSANSQNYLLCDKINKQEIYTPDPQSIHIQTSG